ncbi:MAG: hypothetical protein V1676_06565 [Candidatus Diapherotrites archaeon]
MEQLKFSGREIAFIALVCALGIAARLLFFSGTDIAWDGAWHVMIAYKIATVFWAQPLILAVCLAVAAVLAYLILVRRSVIAAGAAALALLFASLALHVPLTLHPRHPPLFNILASIGIFLTGLAPDVVGKLISTVALIALAFFGLLLGVYLRDKKFGLVLFALLMLSPLSVFYSSTALLNPLEVALCYGSLVVFLFALRNSRLMPIAGAMFACAVATRYTAALIALAFAWLIFENRGWALEKENRKNCAVFALICVAAMGAFLPAMLSSFGGYATWSAESSNYVSDMEHYSAQFVDAMGGEPLQQGTGFYPETLMFFLTPAAALLFIAGALFAIRERNRTLLMLLLIFTAYLAFFTLASQYMAPRYALGMEFPLMAVAAFGIARAWKMNRAAGIAALAAIILLFAWQDAALISGHNFRGLSEEMQKLPQGAKVYTSSLDPVRYYLGIYKTDTVVVNPFFSKLPGVPAQARQEEQRLYYYVNTRLADVADSTDYVVATAVFFDTEDAAALEKFTPCAEIKSGTYTVFWVYAREKCPE